MSTVAAVCANPPAPRWRDLVWPKEHGSWSLALEPVALGLLATPSRGGVALAVAVVAGFFARRPLRIATHDARPERRQAARRAVLACAAAAVGAGGVALWTNGVAWLPWLAPTGIAGAVFLWCDLHRAGREAYAEIAGAVAFACLPAAFARLAGAPAALAASLGAVMLARSLPTVMVVRATVRTRKTGERPGAAPLTAAVGALAPVAVLFHDGLVPFVAVVAVAVLAARAVALLAYPRPTLRASTIGMIEAVVGVLYVLAIAVAW